MSGYIKYFENGGKNMSFLIKDDEVWDKYDKIWDVIKNKLNIKFHSEPVYEYKYLKAKVREFDGMIKTNFLGNNMPKENMHYTCIAYITIDSVLTIEEKIIQKFIQKSVDIWQKKVQVPKFINTELKLDPESDLDSDLEKTEAKFDGKLESDSDNDSGYDTTRFFISMDDLFICMFLTLLSL